MYYILLFLFLYELYKCYKKQRVSFSLLFQLSYWVVFFQIDIFIDYFQIDSLIDYVYKDETLRSESVSLSKFALLSFIFGNIISEYFPQIKFLSKPKVLPKFNLGGIEYLTGFLLILWVLMSGDMIYGEYTPDNVISGRSYVHRLFQVVFTTNLIFRLNKVTYFKFLPNFLKIILISYLLLSFFIGDRGPLFVVLLIFLLFYMRKNRVSIIKFLGAGFLIGILLSIVGSVRQLRFVDSSYTSRFMTVISNFGQISDRVAEGGLFELAKSARCLPAAIDYKKYNQTPFLHFQKMYLLNGLPFLGNLNLQLNNLNPKKYSSSSSLISYHIQSGDVKYGNGTSIIADLYLDFGYEMTVILMLFFGFFIKKSEIEFYKNKNFNITSLFFVIYFSVSIYLPRSAILMQFEKIIFIIIFVYILSFNYKEIKNL